MATDAKAGTRKRTNRKRSTAQRRPSATPKAETTPTTPAPAEVKETKEEVVELTLVEKLVNSIKEDSARIRNDEGKFLDINEGAEYLKTLTDLGIPAARRVHSTHKAFNTANGVMAGIFLQFREAIILADGMPDWFGSSKTYKDAISVLIDEAWKEDSGETRNTVVNRLQRRAKRMLDERVTRFANVDAGLELPEDEMLRILHLKDEATQGENAKNEDAQKLVAAVNKQFRTGVKSSDDSENRAASPFLPKEKSGPGIAGKAEKPAVQALIDAKAFRNALEHLTMPKIGEELLHLGMDVREKALSDAPAFGSPGKKGTVGWMTVLGNIFYVTAKVLDGQELTKEDRQMIEAAEKLAK